MNPLGISDELRNLLVRLIRAGKYGQGRPPHQPSVWKPTQVKDQSGFCLADGFAWELIAEWLDAKHPVELIALDKPTGATGYVMKVSYCNQLVYVKLQLDAGQRFVTGRSFHL